MCSLQGHHASNRQRPTLHTLTHADASCTDAASTPAGPPAPAHMHTMPAPPRTCTQAHKMNTYHKIRVLVCPLTPPRSALPTGAPHASWPWPWCRGLYPNTAVGRHRKPPWPCQRVNIAATKARSARQHAMLPQAHKGSGRPDLQGA